MGGRRRGGGGKEGEDLFEGIFDIQWYEVRSTPGQGSYPESQADLWSLPVIFFSGTHESSRTLDSSVDGLELKACFKKAAASLVKTHFPQ